MKTCSLIALLSLFSISVHAQDSGPSGSPITKAKARAFVACLADMIEIEDKYADDESMFDDVDEDEFEDWTSMIAAMEAHPAYNQVMSTLAEHGFEGAEDWALTTGRFMSAYSAAKMGDQELDMDAEMQKAIDAINESETLSDAQKDDIVESMKAELEMIEAFQQDVSDEEIEAVRSVMEEFEALTIEEEPEEGY